MQQMAILLHAHIKRSASHMDMAVRGFPIGANVMTRKEEKMTKSKDKIKLSIIIPYYNDGDYTKELLDKIAPQMRDDIEVMVIDDGSRIPFETDHKWAKVIHKKNGGVSTARNVGIDKAKGDFITFMDADDSIPPYYVKVLLDKIAETDADVIEYSWKFEVGTYEVRLQSDNEYQVNPAVWCRCFKRAFIGDTRFNELKDSTEDEDFSRKVGYMEAGDYKHVVISDFMYYYRETLPGSKHHRFQKGIMNTKKVVYYYQHVTKEMSWILDEIKKEDERNEVWLFTKQNDIPELKRYCRIRLPEPTWAHIIRGEHYDGITKIKVPLKCQVCIFSDAVNMVGGITTFIYNFCKNMRQYYDIVFLYDNVDPEKLKLIRTVARCIKTKPDLTVACDVLMIQRLNDIIPQNVIYKRSVQMIHCLRLPSYKIRDNVTHKVAVSKAAKESWGESAKDAIVINNIADLDIKKSLMLISATRIGAPDKGSNDNKMIQLANMLNKKGIPFVWLVFGNKGIQNPPKNMYNMQPVPNVGDFIAKADYLVQLSDESFSYTVLEALTRGTAVLVKDFAALKELGFKDGKMGYILPENMDFDVSELLNVPKFEYKYDNDKVIKQWRELIGDLTPTRGFYDGQVKVRAILKEYTDMQLNRNFYQGDEYIVSRARADELTYQLGFTEIVE